MRNVLGVGLLAAGVLVLALPVISDAIYAGYVTELLLKNGSSSVTLSSIMSGAYRFGCMFLGGALLLVTLAGWLSSVRQPAS